MTLSTKPEKYTIKMLPQELQAMPQATCRENLVKYVHAFPEICVRTGTDRLTHRYTHHNTPYPYWDRVIS